MKLRKMHKKGNAILEYSVILMIVALAISGMYYFLKRTVQGRVRTESNTHLGHALGLEWPEQTQTIRWQSSEYNKNETDRGLTDIATQVSGGSVTYSSPVGAKIMSKLGKRAGRDVQDAANQPPMPQYPGLEYKNWQDQGWQLH